VPMTFPLLAPFAIAVAAFMLSLGFFLGTCWAAIHSESTLRSVDDDRAGQPLRARDLHIDRFEYVPDGRRLMGFTVKPIAGADGFSREPWRLPPNTPPSSCGGPPMRPPVGTGLATAPAPMERQ
jgi:hypothetical protein